MSCTVSFILALFLAVILPQGVQEVHAAKMSTSARVPPRFRLPPFGCTGECFVIRRRATRQCARLRRCGGLCNLVPCTRVSARFPDGRAGMRCDLVAGPPTPTPVVNAPVVIVAPTPVRVAPSVTPTMSPSVTPTPSPSPSVSVTPSVTPTNSVSPTPSPSCEFTLAGDLGVVAIGGTCRCGTEMAQVTVLNGVSNDGMPIPVASPTKLRNRQIESLTCYINCLDDLLAGLACDPDSFHRFSSDGQAIVESCCTNCANTLRGSEPGKGVNRPTNQCLLVDP